jgi:bleomycin hydrolase
MDVDLFEYDLVYGRAPSMTKAERLDYGHAQMTHAMVFTGVDLDASDKPLKWRVENSWGDKAGDGGFMQMTDRWFDEHNYEVVVRKRYVPEALLPVLDTEPIALDPWDPMGALAC